MIALGQCAATADIWTDKYQSRSYINMTSHYIYDWKLTRRTLFVTKFPDIVKNHENIRMVMKSKFTKMGFPSQFFEKIIFVTDQGANIKKAIEKDNKRFNCYGHVVNLVLKNTFSDRHKLISEEILKLINNANHIVTHFKR